MKMRMRVDRQTSCGGLLMPPVDYFLSWWERRTDSWGGLVVGLQERGPVDHARS